MKLSEVKVKVILKVNEDATDIFISSKWTCFLYSIILTAYVTMDPGCLSVCVCMCVCLSVCDSSTTWTAGPILMVFQRNSLQDMRQCHFSQIFNI